MSQVCAKIYYLIATGEVLLVTSEMQGCVEETTKEHDMTVYPQLKNNSIDEISYIELQYGSLAAIFNNDKSCSIDPNTKALNCIYFTQEEQAATQAAFQIQQALQERISAIDNYVGEQNSSTMSSFEDLIINTEVNKVMNGEM